ncbi:hypothetical protein P154DRAFT_277149 [Amniculicola lignicola CBS 123094]|uniref:DUF6594 domain-containing protein n=1 Tax=Amniculicola lignicola CBS 123094 TaxID=1392246 RepID=A0A6A5W946_9PLEO|nr:hypothetical protein P154DRAFT_277149 [Amniculicola lignicola CBS 123094]
MLGVKYFHSTLYREAIKHPELLRFRRYTEFGPWLLYGQSAEILRLEEECNTMIRQIPGMPRGRSYSCTDVFPANIKDEYPDLAEQLELLQTKIRDYWKDALLVRNIAQLPDQSRVFAEHFAGRDGLFKDGKFLPTGENEDYYKHYPPHDDTWTPKDVEKQDAATDLIVTNIKRLETVRGSIIRKLGFKRAADLEHQKKGNVALRTITRFMTFISSIYAPVFLTGSMAAFCAVSSLQARIVLSGVLGLLLSLSLPFMVSSHRRGEQYSILAGFYALAGIFVGMSGDAHRVCR